MTEMLRWMKNLPSISLNFSFVVNSCQQIQILYFLVLNQNIQFYRDLITFQSSANQDFLQPIIMLSNFLLNLITLFYFITRSIFSQYPLSKLQQKIFQIIKVKPFIAFFILTFINLQQLCHGKVKYLIVIGTFNILFGFGQIYLTKVINVSYRFIQNSAVNRKNNSVLPWILSFLILLAYTMDKPLYSHLLIILRAVIILYQNIYSVQLQSIQYILYFFPLIQISLSLIFLTQKDNHQISSFIFTLVFPFLIYSCHNLAKTLQIQVPKYFINGKNTHEYFSKPSEEESAIKTRSQDNEIDGNQSFFLHLLRLWVQIYLLRLSQNRAKSTDIHKVTSFSYWWPQFNKLIITHRLYCLNPTCKCQQITRNQDNTSAENQLFQQILFTKLKNNFRFQIVKNYFLIQLLKRPLKAYFQLIRLNKYAKKREQKLQIEMMLIQTRQLFEHTFAKQKVQNQTLSIQPVLQFEDKLIQVKTKMTEISFTYFKFYSLFDNTYVPFENLKNMTSELVEVKNIVDHQLSAHFDKFSRHLEFLTYCLVYYKYFDEYTETLPIVEKKINTFVQPKISSDRVKIDVFDPNYGVVKIDLVDKIGNIVSLTKNIAGLLGYQRNEVIGIKVNKIMPYIFARHHDKFLNNFIQKGSIKMLKLKQRIFYAKTSRKFILPITVRLKVSYQLNSQFSALSLIKKTPTKSNYILLNNYGKIQQISEGIYEKLFKKTFREQVYKVKRLCLYKIILGLNHFLTADKGQVDDRVYDGTFLVSENEGFMSKVFRTYDGLAGKPPKKRDQDTASDLSSRSTFSNYSSEKGNGSSQAQHSIEVPEDMEKCFSDLKQAFKEYCHFIKLDKITAFRIKFKFFEIVTAQFKCKVCQILQINEQVSQNLVKVQIANEIRQVGQLYGLDNNELQKFKNVDFQTLKSMKNTKSRPLIPNPKKMDFQQEESLDGSFDSNFPQNDQNPAKNIIENIGSVCSSMYSTNQKNQQKSLIIGSFSKPTQLQSILKKFLRTLLITIIIFLSVICVFSLRLKPDYQAITHDNIIISNFKTNFEFRLAIQQLYHFYHPFNLEPPEFLVSKKHILTDSMKEQLENSIEWIDKSISLELYQDEMTLKYHESGFQYKRSILSTLGTIYSMFLMTQSQGEHLSDNYPVINQHLTQLSQSQESLIHQYSEEFQTKIHVIISLFIAVLALLVCLLIYINKQAIAQENTLIDFMPFVNIKSIKQKLQFYEVFTQEVKQSQSISIDLVQQIQQLTSQTQRNLFLNKPLLKQRKSFLPNKIVSLLNFNNVQNQEKNVYNATSNSSRLIKIIKGKQKIFSVKSFLGVVGILIICGFIVWQTEYFYFSAHHKFQAYLQLKEVANFVQSAPMRLILLYFINFDKILNQQQIVEYPESFYQMAHFSTFSLRQRLSSYDFNGTEMANSLNEHFNTKICDLIHCQDGQHAIDNLNIYDLTYRFKNAFDYLRMVNQLLQKSQTSRQDIMKWIHEGNVLEVLEGTEHILQLMKINQKQIAQLFNNQIDEIGLILLTFSITLIPFLSISLIIFKNKFIKTAQQRIITTQNIFKQFSWSILSQNRYALNYFQKKLKSTLKI